MEIRIKNLALKGTTGGHCSDARDPHVVFYARPQKIELVKVYPNYLLIEITTAAGYKRTESINSSAIYDGEIVIEDLSGRRLNPWKDFIESQKDSKEEAWARWRRWTRCKNESDV